MKKWLLVFAMCMVNTAFAQMFVPTVGDKEFTERMLSAFKHGRSDYDYDFYMEQRRVRKANQEAVAQGREPTKLAPDFAPYVPYSVPGTYAHHTPGVEGLAILRKRELRENDLNASSQSSMDPYYPYQYTPFEMEKMVAALFDWQANGQVGPKPFVPKFQEAKLGIGLPQVVSPKDREDVANLVYGRAYIRGMYSTESKHMTEHMYPPDYMVYVQTVFWKSSLEVLRAGLKRDISWGREIIRADRTRAGEVIPRPRLYPIIDTIIAEEQQRMTPRADPKTGKHGEHSEVRTLQTLSDEARERGMDCSRMADKYDRGRAWRGNNSNATRQNLNQMIRNNCF